MSILKKYISKYTGVLRSWKATYIVNNWLQKGKLQKNKNALKLLGLDRNVFNSVGTKDLPETDQIPWLDRVDALESLKAHPQFQKFSSPIQAQLIQFVEKGFMNLSELYSSSEVQKHNAIMDELYENGQIYTNYGGTKLMNVHEENQYISTHFFKNETIIEILNFIFDRQVIPFQTIHFYRGSEQKAHSDSIHMSTYPPGYLVGVWTALEDVGEDQGPLFYYPGSHRWPYTSCEDYLSGNTKWTIGMRSYANYEDYMERKVQDAGIEKVVFTPKAGDVLIWHANLIHGGSPMNNKDLTRRSMVGHYYADEVFCYHEISQRPALIDQEAI